MAQVIVFKNNEGGVSVISPSPAALLLMDIYEIADKDTPHATSYKIVDSKDLPDTDFQAAWEADAEHNITINMGKALVIKQNMVRAQRAPLLKDLDVDFMRAVEAGDTAAQSSIASQKQALRDATMDPALLNATTLEELKAAIPEALRAT